MRLVHRQNLLFIMSILVLGTALVSGQSFAAECARATFDTAPDFCGSGPLSTGTPCTIETGTLALTNTGVAESSLFVDPAVGLAGTAKGLHLVDVGPWVSPGLNTVSPNVCTDGTTYWVDFSFRIDPAGSASSDGLIEIFAYDDGGAQLLRIWLGRYDVSGKFRYKFFFNGGSVDRQELAPLSAADEWRVLVRVDAAADTQTHWVWRNGESMQNPILGVPYSLVSPQTTEFDVMTFRTALGGALTDFVLDEFSVANDGPPLPPSGLLAVPQADGSVQLSWTDGSIGEGGFKLERSLTGSGGWTEVADLSANTVSHNDATGLISGTRYYYRVAAYSSGGLSPWSASTWTTTIFVGYPLSDWIDITDHAICAGGGGSCDWSATLQMIIDTMIPYSPVGTVGVAGTHVVYFPDGLYELDSTVFMEGRTGVQFVGESRGGVVLKWTGPSGTNPYNPAVMFHSDGNKRSAYRNLVWDGGAPAGSLTRNYVVAFDQSYCGNTNSTAYNPQCDLLPWADAGSPARGLNDTGSVHIDSEYRNAWIGLRFGHFNVQVDEQTIRRSRFHNNFAGVSVEDANALSLFFWDDEWSNNRYGITNSLSLRKQREDPLCGGRQCTTDTDNWAGDYRILRGRFLENYLDAWVAPTGHFTFRDCWSKGSGQFVYGHGMTTTPGRISLIGCQVDELAPCTENESIVCYPQEDCDPMPDPFLENFNCTAHEGRAVENLNSGALILLDNRFDSTYDCGGSTCDHGPPIYGHTWVTSDIFAVGNGYTVDPSIDPLAPYLPGNNKIRTIDDYLLSPFDLTVPPIPTATDELSTRPVYTVTDVDNIQAVIDAAEADPLPAVVHIPSGRYLIDEPLRIGPGSDLILAGNGTSTELRWLTGGAGTMLEIDGRNAAGVTVRDINLRGINSPNDRGDATCIEVSHVNQDGAAVLLNKVAARNSAPGSEDAGIVIDECDRVQVDIVDLQSAGNKDNIGVLVQAGPQPEQVPKVVWTGTVLGNEWDFDIVNNVNGVRFMVSSTYMEDSVHYLRARGDSGPGEVVVHSGKMAIQNPFVSPPLFDDAVTLDDFSGNLSVIGCRMVDQEGDTPAILRQTGDAAVNVQMIGNAVYDNPAYAVEPSAYLIRTSEKYWCLDAPDDHPECYDGNNQLLLGWRPVPDQGQFPEDNDLLLDGLDLLRTVPMPGFYNDTSATTAYNVIVDSVIVGQCASGIVLSGDLPPAPSGLVAAAIGPTQIDLAWVDPDGNEEGFRVERSFGGSSFVEVGTTGPDDTFFSDTGLDPGTRYHYRVAATHGFTGDSGFAGPADAVTPLLEPTALQVTGFDCGSVSLQWNDANVAEDGFRIERAGNPVDGFDVVGNAPAGAVSFVDGTVEDGRIYFYQVVAFNAETDSPPSNIVNTATVSCDDEVSCTTDSCDVTGQCVHTENCPGGQACSESLDRCALNCFDNATCNDGLDCTLDLCLFELGLPGTPGFCRNQQTCTDGDACTVNDCNPGSNSCSSTPLDCDDDDQCTVDGCDSEDGCTYTPVDCFDDDVCTIDSCDPATGCFNPPVDCDDGIECTTDDCDPVTGCTHLDNCPGGQVCSEPLGRCTTHCFENSECDDGRACTLDLCLFELGLPGTPGFCRSTDTCSGGSACAPEVCSVGGVCIEQPLDCNDGDSCTFDVCDPGSGCEHVGICPLPQGPAGQVPDGAVGSGEQLLVTKEIDGTISLSWDGSCLATDGDFAIFEGTLSDTASHLPIYCSTQGATFKSFAPAAGSRYYLVAPVSADREGSYGVNSLGLERGLGPASCLVREIDACE